MIECDILAPPTLEPVTLTEAKTWLKVDGSDDDLLIAGLISSARLTVEALTGLLLLTQTWRFRIGLNSREREIKLPHRPLISLNGAKFQDRTNGSRAAPLDGLSIGHASAGTIIVTDDRIYAISNFTLLEIDAVMGYGSSSASVPTPILTAMRMLISFWYERRGDDARGMAEPWPASLSTLLQPYREIKL